MANVVNSFDMHKNVLFVHFVEESSTPWIWDGPKQEYIKDVKVVVKLLAHALTDAALNNPHKARQLISAIHVCRNHI